MGAAVLFVRNFCRLPANVVGSDPDAVKNS
jgi:hypothetical protein